jgi:sugar phosphate isomerase/epimerase
MKAGVVICGPDVRYGPLALLSGTFEEKAEKAAHLGYDGIELMVRDPAGLDWQAVKRTLDSAGLEVPQVVTGELFGADGLCLVTADMDLYRRAEKRVRSVIDLAAFLGAMVNIGRLRGRLDSLAGAPDAWKTAVERMRGVGEYARDQGVKITLEPINRYETDFLMTAAEGMRFIEEMGCENVGLMLDLFHMNIEEDSIEAGLCRAGKALWHVHIADSNRNYPGSGHMAYASIFQTLREMDYAGYVSAELRPLPDPDTAAQKTIAFLKERL